MINYEPGETPPSKNIADKDHKGVSKEDAYLQQVVVASVSFSSHKFVMFEC